MNGPVGPGTSPLAAAPDAPRFEEILRQAPAIICILDGPDHRFAFANEGYLALVGHRDLVGKTLLEAMPELAGQGFKELLDEVRRSGKPYVGNEVEVSLVRRPGAAPESAIMNFVYQPVLSGDGTVNSIFVHAVEVTELVRSRRRAEQANALLSATQRELDRERENLRALFQQAPLVVAIMRGPEHRFEYVNPAHVQLLHKDATGMTVREAQPEAVKAFELLDQVYRTGQRVESKELPLPVGNELRYFDFVYAPSRDVDGRVDGVMCLAADITDQVRMRHEAERANRLKDEFLTTVSHELRTPLTSILGWVQMLRAGSLEPTRVQRALETIERNARAQTQLVEDLLDMSRIVSGTLKLDPAPVLVAAVVEQAVENVRPAAEAKHLALTVSIRSQEPISGDPARLQQIAWNLLTNAVKFTPRGGRVTVSLEDRGPNVVLTVADTGQGIAPAFLPHVFERFRQADASPSRRGGGLGLGLSIVRHLAELHGGSVAVHSDGPGHGAVFTVKLPSLNRAARPTTAELRLDPAGLRRPPELSGKRVLVVEDEADTREMLRVVLEHCQAKVTLAVSAAEALAQVNAEPPDLILSDIGLPGEDGYAFLRKLRDLPDGLGRNIPAVALTAFARGEDRARALLAGFNSHVPKPVEAVELLTVLASVSQRGLA